MGVPKIYIGKLIVIHKQSFIPVDIYTTISWQTYHPGDEEKGKDISSPLFNFNFPKPPPLASTPKVSAIEPIATRTSDYDIPRSLHNPKLGKEKMAISNITFL